MQSNSQVDVGGLFYFIFLLHWQEKWIEPEVDLLTVRLLVVQCLHSNKCRSCCITLKRMLGWKQRNCCTSSCITSIMFQLWRYTLIYCRENFIISLPVNSTTEVVLSLKQPHSQDGLLLTPRLHRWKRGCVRLIRHQINQVKPLTSFCQSSRAASLGALANSASPSSKQPWPNYIEMSHRSSWRLCPEAPQEAQTLVEFLSDALICHL